MSRVRSNPSEEGERPFMSVAEAASLLGTSEMTLYRAINAGEFPAVRIRGRIIVPRQAIQTLAVDAMTAVHEAAAREFSADDLRQRAQ